jgi:hypothetical protein
MLSTRARNSVISRVAGIDGGALGDGQSCCEAQGRPKKTIVVNAQLNLDCHFAVVAMVACWLTRFLSAYLDHSRHLSERFRSVRAEVPPRAPRRFQPRSVDRCSSLRPRPRQTPSLRFRYRGGPIQCLGICERTFLPSLVRVSLEASLSR